VGPTVSSKALRPAIFAAAVRTGKAPRELAEMVGVAPSNVTDADARVPHALIARVWETLAAHCGDAHLGLFAASLLAAAPLDLVDMALDCAPDFRSMVAGFLRFQRLFHDANESLLEVRGEWAIPIFRLGPEAPRCRHLCEFVLATWSFKVRRDLGPRFALAGVRMVDAGPARADAFARAFGDVPVEHGAREDALVFPAALLDAPLVGADGAAWARLQTQLEGALAKREPGASFVDGARRQLQAELLQGRADVKALARALAVSTRSLQRRLTEEGTSFSDLLDKVRRELAVSHMHRADTSVTEIAFLLGFSDLSAFSRAFRRWTGASPSAYRHDHVPH
jgi:AraC-like DNA-binding protein